VSRTRDKRGPSGVHRPFGLVLCGGGGRGFCHVGVLRALEHHGYRPSAIVGVSMGAIVAVTYGLNRNWYRALIDADVSGFPAVPGTGKGLRARVSQLRVWERVVVDMLFGWGVGQRYRTKVMKLLRGLTGGGRLEACRPPVAVVATDLTSGGRVVLDEGDAASAAYASSAHAGLFPPLQMGDALLVDGAYADLAPIDVARSLGAEAVIAVHPELPGHSPNVSNGLHAMIRAVDICNIEHTRMNLAAADLVLRPDFPVLVETLDFTRMRLCAAAGARTVRGRLREIARVARA
jgi:NTE family protein